MTDGTITRCKERATQAMERFLRVLSFVPADKLNWSPAPTAMSSLRIAAHCAAYSEVFAGLIRDCRFPATVEEFTGPIQAKIESITSIEQAETVLREGIANTVTALDTVQPDQINAIVDTPIGPTPFSFFMNIPADHLLNHIGQIDYLQTCWGDEEVHL